jgi:hypothetical protein
MKDCRFSPLAPGFLRGPYKHEKPQQILGRLSLPSVTDEIG